MSFFRDTDEPDDEFHRACLKGDTATVRRLLDIEDERLSRSATDPIYGYAHVPLHLACFGGHRETVYSEQRLNDFLRANRPSWRSSKQEQTRLTSLN